MSLHYIYSNASNSTQDITAWCRLYRYSATTYAKEGAVAHSTLIVDDPDAIHDFVGHRRLYTYEDLAAASNQVVHNGFIAGIKVSRGPYRNGAGRIWTLDLADTNVLLNRRIMNGEDASRPEETDVRRQEVAFGVGALAQMTEFNTIDDTLYFSGVGPVDMDAADYRTQPAGTGYVDDSAQASGKNYFVWYREATGQYSYWYDFAASSNWTGTKRLSNVLADVDNTTTFAVDLENEAVLDRDPSRIASGVMLPFDGVASGSNTVSGTVYVQSATTTATYAAIDWLAPSVNVKSKAKALARAQRYVDDASSPDDLIQASVKLPAANVNDFMAGMRFEAKFSHLPGYETFTSFRCLARTVTEISEDPTRAYRLDLELSPIPTPVEVYSILYSTESGPISSPAAIPIYFDSSGDRPDSGFLPDPTIGPVEQIPGPDYPGVGTFEWYAFRMLGTGTIDVTLSSSVAGVPIIGDTVTMDITKNGVVVGSDTCGPAVSNFTWAPDNPDLAITVTGLAVVPGDVVAAQLSNPRGASFSVPQFGTQQDNFILTGTLVPA